uniref:Uncharacterized protein n=1 Tax=Anguilla anguilla TaxID=7936 RepID=A0A0E9U698_ANGAN
MRRQKPKEIKNFSQLSLREETNNGIYQGP